MVDDMLKNDATIYLGGLFAVTIGYFMVSLHNVWSQDWTVLVTILGWTALVKGVLILAFPKSMMTFTKKVTKLKHLNVVGFGLLAFGLAFAYWGFFAY